MNYLVKLLLLLFIVGYSTGCNIENHPSVQSLPIIAELSIYCVKYDEHGVVDKNEVKSNVLVLNSQEDVKRLLKNDFLQLFSGYLDVDFSKYTLLVKTSIIDYEIVERKISYYWSIENNQEAYNYQIDYKVGKLLPNGEFSIERIAIVVDKLEESDYVNYHSSISAVNVSDK